MPFGGAAKSSSTATSSAAAALKLPRGGDQDECSQLLELVHVPRFAAAARSSVRTRHGGQRVNAVGVVTQLAQQFGAVFAQLWWLQTYRRATAVQRQRKQHRAAGASVRQRQRRQPAGRQQMRIIQEVLRPRDRRKRQGMLLKDGAEACLKRSKNESSRKT